MTLPAGYMVQCDGCGHFAEVDDVVEYVEHSDEKCLRCTRCERHPELRESYRRGFNAGLDALAEAVKIAVQGSNLRRRAP